jgi:hypothetical protein
MNYESIAEYELPVIFFMKIDLQMFKKGSSTTNVQSYTPTAQEVGLQQNALDYSKAVAPNALNLNNLAANQIKDAYGTVNVNYGNLTNDALKQQTAAQQGVSNLTQGILPTSYTQNMTDSIKSGVDKTVGSTMNNLAQSGVLNSSVTSGALNDISKNVSDTMAQNYLNNVSTLNGLYGQQSSLANAPIQTALAGQEASLETPSQLWNMSLGINQGGTLGALNSLSGKGTTTSTSTQSGGGGLFGSVLGGLASNSGLFCFVTGTKITLADGTTRNIEDMQVGDGVASHGSEKETVIALMPPHYNDVYEVATDIGKVVETTDSQPLLKDDGEYILVKDLTVGMSLYDVGKVASIGYRGEYKVYDLQISGVNNYIANGFVAKGGEGTW